VEAVGLGLVTLRRPLAGPGGRTSLRRFEELRGGADRVLGGHLGACLAAHDWLAGPGRDLEGARLRVASDITEERHHRPGEEEPAVILLRQGGGFGRTVRVGTAVAALVGACDGELGIGQLVAALAHLLERPVAELRSEVLPEVTGLVRDGFLGPVEPR
jgi:hypothetical protein